MKFDSESDLAARVVQWLENMKWEVYQEVETHRMGAVADIVAVQDNRVWVIECKRSFGVAVLSQAFEWKRCANFVSVATPFVKRDWKERCFIKELSDHFGIGMIDVRPDGTMDFGVTIDFRAAINRTADTLKITDCLTEQHKTFAKAGNADGHRYTPFQSTCDNLRSFLKKNPGASLKMAVEGIGTHYRTPANARASLSHWIRRGIVKGVEARREGRNVKLFLL